MVDERLMIMNITSNILSAYYTAINSYCVLKEKEPNAGEKETILKEVLSTYENLSTSYLNDIAEISENIRLFDKL